MYIHNLSTRPSYENPCQHVGKINQKINPPYIPAANYNDQTAEYLLPRYITQQRTVDKSFKLHVPKTPSFGPVRKQRSPTQWQPRGSRNTQTRAKSSTLAFCSGSAATDSSAGAATRGKGCKGAGAPCTMARSNFHKCFDASSTFCYHLRSPQRHRPMEGKSCGALQRVRGRRQPRRISHPLHATCTRTSSGPRRQKCPERVEKCVGC